MRGKFHSIYLDTMNNQSVGRRTEVHNSVGLGAARMREAAAEGHLQTMQQPLKLKVKSSTLDMLQASQGAIAWTRKMLPLGTGNNGSSIIESHGEAFIAFRRGRRAWDKFLDSTSGLNRAGLLFGSCKLLARYKAGACGDCSDLTAVYLLEQKRLGSLPKDTKICQVRVDGVDHVQTLVGLKKDFDDGNAADIAVADAWIELPVAHTLDVSSKIGFQMTEQADFKAGKYSDTRAVFLKRHFDRPVPGIEAAFAEVEKIAARPYRAKGAEQSRLKLEPSSERLSLAGRGKREKIWCGADHSLDRTLTKVSYRGPDGRSVNFDRLELNGYFDKTRALRVSLESGFFTKRQKEPLPVFDTRFDYKAALTALTQADPGTLLDELAKTPDIASEMFRELVSLGLRSRTGRMEASVFALQHLLIKACDGGPGAASARQMFISIVDDAMTLTENGQENNVCFARAVARVLSLGVPDDVLEDIGGLTPLVAATVSGDLDLIEELCVRGESVTAQVGDYDAPAEVALRMGNEAALRILLGKGAGVGAYLLAAINDSDSEELRLLIGQGVNVDARVDANGSTALHAALATKNSEAVSLLILAGASTDVAAEGGQTALHFAASNNDRFDVRNLLRAGASIDKRDGAGATALHRAIRSGNHDVVIELLNHRPDVDAATGTGQTPLHTAVRCGRHDAIQALLARNATACLVDAQGKTALDLATARSDAEAIRLLTPAANRESRRALDTV